MPLSQDDIKEKLKQAKNLLKEKRFNEAAKNCQEILAVFSDNTDALKFLAKIKEEYLSFKDETVQKTIKASQALWKDKKYDELKKIYNELEIYYPRHPKVQKGLELLKEVDRHAAVQKFEEQFLQAESFYYKKDYENTVKICQAILEIDPEDEKAKDLLEKAREKYVDAKLPLVKEIDPNDFGKLRDFYFNLYEVAPQYGKIRRLLGTYEEKINQQKKAEERKFISEKIIEIKKIIEKGTYDEAIEDCEELLKLDPNHPGIKKILSLSKRKQEAIIDQELLKHMKEIQLQLSQEYKADKTKFVKI